MAVVLGIDEAGYGPLLGPLVVSSSSFTIDSTLLKADLWQILRKSIADRRKHLAGRLLIADSKKAYSRSGGVKHLERTVLACMKILGQSPACLTDLVNILCPDSLRRLESYPWYANIEDYKIVAEQADIAIASDVFEDDLSSNGIKLLGLKSRCLDVAHYNKLVDNVKNKANVLFTATSQLIKSAWDNCDENELQVIVDRQGGRVHYRDNLQRMFGDLELTILTETPANSSYELRGNKKKMRLHFAVGADSRFLPVSLASMVSKYVRELLVHNINQHFVSMHADLKPTAGYWKDGLRFIKDLKENIPHLSLDMNQLVRSR